MRSSSLNGKYRDEFLSEHWFESIAEAAEQAELWRVDYNEQRPHTSLGKRTPAEVRAAHERGCAATTEASALRNNVPGEAGSTASSSNPA